MLSERTTLNLQAVQLCQTLSQLSWLRLASQSIHFPLVCSVHVRFLGIADQQCTVAHRNSSNLQLCHRFGFRICYNKPSQISPLILTTSLVLRFLVGQTWVKPRPSCGTHVYGPRRFNIQVVTSHDLHHQI